MISWAKDEELIKWLALSPSTLQHIPKLTQIQEELGMSKDLIIIANQVFDFAKFRPSFDDEDQNRFARLQTSYQIQKQIVCNEKKSNQTKILTLSPRMEIASDQERLKIKQLFSEYLENQAEKASLELEKTLVNEERRKKVQEEKKKTLRKKKKDRKKKKAVLLRSKNDGSDSNVLLDKSRQNQCEENDMNMNQFEHQLSKDSSQCQLSDSNDILPRCLLPKTTRTIHPMTFLKTVESSSNCTKDQSTEIHLRSYNNVQSNFADSIQQVQLKAYIAETKALAAQERSEILEQLLKKVLSEDNVVSAMSCELRDEIISNVQIDCTKVTRL